MLLVKESVYTCLLFCLFVLFLQAFEDYEFQHIIPHDSRTKYIISVINIILAALFTTEMVLRWIGFGITRYFTNAWTLIDFVVVLVSSLFGSVTLIDFVVVLVSSLFGSVTLIDFVVVLVSSLFGSVTLIDFVVVLVSSLFGSVTLIDFVVVLVSSLFWISHSH